MKFKSIEEAKEMKPQISEDFKVAKKAYLKFCKDNNLEVKEDGTEDHSSDEKNGKRWSKLNKQFKQAQKNRNDLTEYLEKGGKKEKKASTPRTSSKYDYPAGMSAADKKKFRSAARAAAKKAAKEASGGGKKSNKKEKASEQSNKEESKKSSKKGAKSDKKAEKKEKAED